MFWIKLTDFIVSFGVVPKKSYISCCWFRDFFFHNECCFEIVLLQRYSKAAGQYDFMCVLPTSVRFHVQKSMQVSHEIGKNSEGNFLKMVQVGVAPICMVP